MTTTTPLLGMLAAARQAGLAIEHHADGQLVVRGPRQHGQLVQTLLARKPDVIAVLAVYNGIANGLDWRSATVLDAARPCAICRRPTILLEPYDGRPCHKLCAEAAIRQDTPTVPGDRQ